MKKIRRHVPPCGIVTFKMLDNVACTCKIPESQLEKFLTSSGSLVWHNCEDHKGRRGKRTSFNSKLQNIHYSLFKENESNMVRVTSIHYVPE